MKELIVNVTFDNTMAITQHLGRMFFIIKNANLQTMRNVEYIFLLFVFLVFPDGPADYMCVYLVLNDIDVYNACI